MPFAGYKDFNECVARNQDKANPEAYCGTIRGQAERPDDAKKGDIQPKQFDKERKTSLAFR